MPKIATRGKLLTSVLAYEENPAIGVCREAVTVTLESTMDIGAVVVKALSSATVTPVFTGTGNGALGAVTVADYVNTGVYYIRIVKAASNAGDFVLVDPAGDVIGHGTVGVAFAQAGFSFTLADGATDFVVGDSFKLTVAGTIKYKWVKAAHIDTLNDDVCVLIDAFEDPLYKDPGDYTLAVLARGHAGIIGTELQYGDTLSTTQKNIVLAKLKAKDIANKIAV